MKTIRILIGMMFMASLAVVISCNDDDDPDALTIVSIEATGTDVESGETITVDLNAATAPSNVPVDPTVTITFSRELNAETVNNTTVQLLEGSNSISVTLSVDGAVVTATPDEELARGTDYMIDLGASIEATDGGEFTAVVRSFTTGGRAPVIPPNESAQVAYWSFNGDDTDELGNYSADDRVDITYVVDRFGQASSSASFNGTTSIIEVPDATDLIGTNDFTLSFWVKPNTIDKTSGFFVIGLAGSSGFQFEIAGGYGSCKLAAQYELADGNSAGQDLWWSTTGNLGWQGWTFDQDLSGQGGLEALIDQKWSHFVVTYNSSTKVGSIYVNGVLRKSQDFNLYGETHPLFNAVGLTYSGEAPAHTGNLAIGFISDRASTAFDDTPWGEYELPTSNHYQGEIDDLRIFHAAFSEEDAQALYNAEKP